MKLFKNKIKKDSAKDKDKGSSPAKESGQCKDEALSKADLADLRNFLRIIDSLVGDIPQKRIEDFTKSEDFKIYRSIMNKFVPEIGLDPEDIKEFKKQHLAEIEKKIDSRIKDYIEVEKKIEVKQDYRPKEEREEPAAARAGEEGKNKDSGVVNKGGEGKKDDESFRVSRKKDSKPGEKPDMSRIKEMIEKNLKAGKG